MKTKLATKKLFRVTWLERYSEIVEAENEDAATENRTGDEAFIECMETAAVEVRACQACHRAPGGCAACGFTGWIERGS